MPRFIRLLHRGHIERNEKQLWVECSGFHLEIVGDTVEDTCCPGSSQINVDHSQPTAFFLNQLRESLHQQGMELS